MLRLFVGLGLPEDLRDTLAMLERGIPGARWIESDNYHITLRFIGEVAENQAEDIDSALAGVQAAPFALSLAGVGHFGKLRKARSVWAGVEANEALDRLQAGVGSAIVRAGFPAEARKFRPHVTLARIKGETGHHVANFLSEHGDFRAPPFEVRAFILYESQLTRHGAMYRALQSYPLG
ncbi:MAG: RNA 2',3'-cyclic phosphodiesterase [Rhodospirillaceae bacterium]|nr:RNA 2',3'-cyclic phosphodiesterase [Rhodospirillaceae bacterium]MYH38622.1 RNA 2',3'-cyclic phosphodiesterase [Rhodospirillaceae bacterium]MYK13914.1 RNA 2',3'-cyclic phosphodiesterase [Rhodospirillaceae bacterium]MYK59647.1 RNA 2',3'-cyclic phosphodiesterase [Rhodospirillaceae bacterium]